MKERIVIDQDICISCGACLAVCPTQSMEMNENNKARYVWDTCDSDFECIKICPVNAIWPASQAPAEAKSKNGWYRFSKPLEGPLREEFEKWKNTYGITGLPA
ncbi:MAG: 4Fe-4S binding protein [Sulfolobales archaeon]